MADTLTSSMGGLASMRAMRVLLNHRRLVFAVSLKLVPVRMEFMKILLIILMPLRDIMPPNSFFPAACSWMCVPVFT